MYAHSDQDTPSAYQPPVVEGSTQRVPTATAAGGPPPEAPSHGVGPSGRRPSPLRTAAGVAALLSGEDPAYEADTT